MLHLIGKQLRVYKLFKENEIPVALFKGPLLAQMAYGEISLRQAGDIDMLIHRQHFDQARLLLESLGYQMFPKLTPAQLASHLNNHCEIQFMRDEWFTVVDLHWDLAPRSFVFKVKADEVMSRLQSVSLAGTDSGNFWRGGLGALPGDARSEASLATLGMDHVAGGVVALNAGS